MFGSDWPVCTMARDASYHQTFQAYLQSISNLTEEEKQAIFCNNVVKFYGIRASGYGKWADLLNNLIFVRNVRR